MNVQRWYTKRSAHVRKSNRVIPARSAAALREVPDLDAYVQSVCHPLALQYGAELNRDPIQGMLEFMTRQDARKKVRELTKSDALFGLVTDSIHQSWADVIATTSRITTADLEKAADPKSWKRVASKHDQEAADLVDHSIHIQNHPAPSHYAQVLADPKHKMKPIKVNNGVSAKMVHEAPESRAADGSLMGNVTMMAKPYHKKIESATRSWVKHPITGWATIATKGLFNAANIGHLAEDVTAHEHEGIPLTVHKFADNMRELNDANGARELAMHQPDPDDLMKIGVMDFLSNNLDRHMGNLLISSDPGDTDSRGYNKVMAIDHERNFQYDKTAKEHHAWNSPSRYRKRKPGDFSPQGTPFDNRRIEAPNDYMEHGRAIGALLRMPHNQPHYLGDLAEWWTKHSEPVKKEFLKHVSAIKDENLRNHLQTNFMDRAKHMDSWAKNGLETDQLYDMDTMDSVDYDGKPRGVSNSKFQTVPVAAAKKMAAKADLSKPGKVMDGLADFVRQYKASTKHARAAHDILGSVVERMTPEQAVEAVKHIEASPNFGGKKLAVEFPMKNYLLGHIRDSDDKGKIRAMAEHLESTDDSQNKLWARELRGILGVA